MDATIIELSLVGFRTRTVEAVSDLINFLEKNPPPQTVLQYHASTKSEERLYRLMALSEAGVLSAKEKAELAELEKLEHIVVMLKAKARKILKKKSVNADKNF